MSRLAAVVIAGLALSLLAVGCSETHVETMDVVGSIPWGDHEEAHYRLVDRDGSDVGSGVLRIDGEDGRFRLAQTYTDGSNSDASEVLVEADTLKPVSVRREIHSDGDTEEVEAEYGPTEVKIRSGDRQSFLSLPEHFYDNESAVFVWRTIAFKEGLVLRHHTILTNRRDSAVVTVEVVGKEQVEVPAGTFEAWRLDIRSGSVRQAAWYADDARRHLLKYDNSRQVFLLQEAPEE
jgi:hypothetical protein